MVQDWPGSNDERVVAEMMSDDSSPHWGECYLFVTHLVFKMNVPAEAAQDVIQQSVLSVRKSLAEFRYESSLKSWISRIVANKVLDELRRHIRDKARFISIDISKDADESEHFQIAAPQTVEERYLQREKLREVIFLLREFASHRQHRTRDALILRLIMLEDYTPDQVANKLGINRPVVYAVLRAARIYLREHWAE